MDVLREACEATSQIKVAAELGVSSTMISQDLSGKYAANPKNLEARVRGALMSETIECPVLGVVSKHQCQEEQRSPFAITNPLRVRLFAACKTCPSGGGAS